MLGRGIGEDADAFTGGAHAAPLPGLAGVEVLDEEVEVGGPAADTPDQASGAVRALASWLVAGQASEGRSRCRPMAPCLVSVVRASMRI